MKPPGSHEEFVLVRGVTLVALFFVRTALLIPILALATHLVGRLGAFS